MANLRFTSVNQEADEGESFHLFPIIQDPTTKFKLEAWLFFLAITASFLGAS